MSKQQGILLIADGLGDRPIPNFGGKTPLEYANTPVLDQLCAEGIAGLLHPYLPGCRVGTDWGHLCLFGYDPQQYYTGRGAIECYSAGLQMQSGDVAFRGNLATVDAGFKVLDRRAGRIHEKADITALIAAVDGISIDDCKFYIRSLTEHRIAILMRGQCLTAQIPDTDPGTACEGKRVVSPQGAGCDTRSARLLWKFLLRVHAVWNQHPINQQRLKRGAVPANFILTRGSAASMVLPSFSSLFPQARAAVIAGDVTIAGIARMCGMDAYLSESFTGSFVTDYAGKAKLALEQLENHDLVIVHVKGTDLCGHDNAPEKKVAIIQEIDKMFGFWRQAASQPLYLGLTADHSTPCHLREHSGDPVPTFLWGAQLRTDSCSGCGERPMMQGALQGYTGAAFMRTIMDYLDFSRKYGA